MSHIISPLSVDTQGDACDHLVGQRVDHGLILIFPLNHLAFIWVGWPSWIGNEDQVV